MRRLATGGVVERGREVSFAFDGRRVRGFGGDTLASALLASGVRVFGRSFKYHRPRGVLAAGSEEPNALVTVGEGAAATPNTRATVQEVYDGLVARSQNCWPSLRFDVAAVNDLAAPLIGAGFYYKTFMWPRGFWEKVYEPVIRRAAGLGALSGERDPDRCEKAFGFCDLLVIGGGPAGLMAALTAGRAGARVILADEDFRLGGRLNAERLEVEGRPGGGVGRCGRGGAAELAERAADAADDGHRRLRRRDIRGTGAGGGACVGAAGGCAAAMLLAHRGAAGGAVRGGAGAADRVPGERPAGGDARRFGSRLSPTLGGGAGAGRGLHRQRRRLAHGGGSRGGRGGGGGARRLAPRRGAARRTLARLRRWRGRRHPRASRAPRGERAARRDGSSGSRSTAWRSRGDGTRRCI